MQIPPPSASEHYREQQRVTATVLLAAGAIVGENPPADPERWWREKGSQVVDLTAAGQGRVVRSSSRYVEQALIETTGADIRPDVAVDTSSLVGTASDGRSLDSLLYGPVQTYLNVVQAAGTTTGTVDDLIANKQSWRKARTELELRIQTQVADAERVATGLEITSRKGVGYTRIARVGACSRCAVLAGRWYRWSEGFLRHPLCMCRHIPATKKVSEKFALDAREYFDALPEREQNKIFTRAGADSIRAGADINQVVNARRGTASGLDTAAGTKRRNVYGKDLITTTEGTTKRGFAGKLIRDRGRDPRTTPRLMPEDIYAIATDREDALRLLELNGYAFDRAAPLNRGSLGGGKKPDRPEVDLDALERARVDRERLERERVAAEKAAEQLRLYLDAEARWTSDVEKYLAAEKKFQRAEAAKNRTPTLLSAKTRKLVTNARASLPQGKAGWLDTTLKYPVDSSGAKLVPKLLQDHLDTTLNVGAAIRADVRKVFAKDKELKALRKDLTKVSVLNPLYKSTSQKIAKREQDIIRRALAEVRSFGTVEQSAAVSDMNLYGATRGTADAVAAVRRVESIYPDEWLEAANAKGEIRVGKSDRAFYSSTWDYIAADQSTVKTHPNYRDYRGAFDTLNDEVMAHELGHRMESVIPGLTYLEYALVRSRSIIEINGKQQLEPLSDIYAFDTGKKEVGYADEWRDKYAGKSYSSPSASNPASDAAEAFQVGVQDTFGRNDVDGPGEFDRSGQLQEFVMGVLVLL